MKKLTDFLKSNSSIVYTLMTSLFIFLLIPVSVDLITYLASDIRDLMQSLEMALQETWIWNI